MSLWRPAKLSRSIWHLKASSHHLAGARIALEWASSYFQNIYSNEIRERSPELSTLAVKHGDTLEKATDLFWRDGYEGVSIEEVVKATGVNRYALYQLFGGKKGLFLASLDAYCEHGKCMTMEILADPKKRAFDGIREVIGAKLKDPAMFRAGCLMTTTAVEMAVKDVEISERLQFYMSEMKGVMCAALSRAQAEGDIDKDTDIAGVSEILFNLFVGAGVQARMGIPQHRVAASIDSAFNALRSKKTS